MTRLALSQFAKLFVGEGAAQDASARNVGLVGNIESPRLRQKFCAAGHFEQSDNPFHATTLPRFAL